jgi:hypothetical protein
LLLCKTVDPDRIVVRKLHRLIGHIRLSAEFRFISSVREPLQKPAAVIVV